MHGETDDYDVAVAATRALDAPSLPPFAPIQAGVRSVRRRRRAVRNAVGACVLVGATVTGWYAASPTGDVKLALSPPSSSTSGGPAVADIAPSIPATTAREPEATALSTAAWRAYRPLGTGIARGLMVGDFLSVDVEPNAVVSVDMLESGSTDITLTAGRVDLFVLPRPPGASVRVLTPLAIVEVVGTLFEVQHHPGHGTTVRTHEGLVRVIRRDGRSARLVPAGHSAHVVEWISIRSRLADTSTGTSQERRALSALPAQAARPSPAGGRIRSGAVSRQRSAAPLAPVGVKPAMEPAEPTDVAPPVTPPPAPRLTADERFGQARERLARGQAHEALELLQPLVTSSTHRRRALLSIGDAYMALKKPEAAVRAWRRALVLTKGDPGALVADLARALSGPLRDHAAAEALWVDYLSDFPQGRRARNALRFLGARYLAGGRLDAAEALFSRHTSGPGAETALVGLIRVHLKRGHVDTVRLLGAEYQRRFPTGLRRAEVRALLGALD